MKILFVVNNAYVSGNGLSASCQRTVRYLREAGEDVRILSGACEGAEKPDYVLEGMTVPVFDGLIRKQGYSFAKKDDEVIEEAVRWADLVHLEEPFDLQIRTCTIAKREHKPVTATYHLHPENLFSSIHLGHSLYLNGSTMLVWLETVFNRCLYVQCPTENVRERLEKWHCRAELRVISNGMPPRERLEDVFVPCPVQKEEGTYLLVSTGRYSVEKDQITLLHAMRHSHYADRIQLVLAGRGPHEAALRREAEALVSEGILKRLPEFLFCSMPELEAIYREADLYIHCATVEVEGLSCMEAIETGLVPVIAEGHLTATAQFALSEESRYPQRNAQALAERIDYWLSDDMRRQQEARRYVGMGQEYDISRSIEQLRKMFRDAADRALHDA